MDFNFFLGQTEVTNAFGELRPRCRLRSSWER